jgi:hypothetical protein
MPPPMPDPFENLNLEAIYGPEAPYYSGHHRNDYIRYTSANDRIERNGTIMWAQAPIDLSVRF